MRQGYFFSGRGKIRLSKRGVYEPVVTEEHVVAQIRQGLALFPKVVQIKRVYERIPSCCNPRCRHYKSEHSFGGVGPCRKCPCQHYRGAKTSEPGIPDLIGYLQIASPVPGHDGRAHAIPLYIEVKRPGGVRRTAQTQFIDEARKAGCVAFFAESWEDVRREFEAVGLRLPA